MRKIKIILLIALLMMVSIFPATAEVPVKVMLDGKEMSFDQPPIIEDGRTLIPFRAIFEALKAEVDWDEKTKTVKGIKGNLIIELIIGEKNAKVNSQTTELDVAAKIKNERTLVPIRFVSENFGAKVDWDGNTKTVFITTEQIGNTNVKTSDGMTVEGMDNLRKLYDYDGRFSGEKMIGREFNSIFTINGKNASWDCVSHPELNTWKTNDMTKMTRNGFSLMGGGYSVTIEKGMVIDYKVTPEKGSPFDVRIRL